MSWRLLLNVLILLAVIGVVWATVPIPSPPLGVGDGVETDGGSGVTKMGVAVQAISSVISVIVAAVAVFVAYRLRPLRMRSIELHSDQLKDTIREWISNLDDPALPDSPSPIPSTGGYIDQIPKPAKYSIPLEGDILFKDLPSHLPHNVMGKWATYKADRDKYLKNKHRLTEAVLDFVKKSTGFNVHDGNVAVPQEDVLFANVLRSILDDVKLMVDGQPRWHFIADYPGLSGAIEFRSEVLCRGARGLIHCVEDSSSGQGGRAKAQETYATLTSSLKENENLTQLLQEHRQEYSSLQTSRKSLISDLEKWLVVPILPKPDCDIIRLAAS